MFDPFFHANGLRSNYKNIVDIANDMINSVEKINADGSVNLTETMQKYISFVIAKTLLEIDDQQEFHSYTPRISNVFAGVAVQTRNKNTFWLPWKHRSLKGNVTKDLMDVRSYFKRQIMRKLQGDLELSSLFSYIIKSNIDGDQLKIEDTINEMIMFFFAGIDTSMHTINFAFYEMLRNRQLFYEIENEILDVSN